MTNKDYYKKHEKRKLRVGNRYRNTLLRDSEFEIIALNFGKVTYRLDHPDAETKTLSRKDFLWLNGKPRFVPLDDPYLIS